MTPTRTDALEPRVGLEVHAQLQTATKLFCGCPVAFGHAPNSQSCPVCLGLPGALPVLNRKAVEHALRLCLALSADVHRVSQFARKHYFYPDLPKGFQVSQYNLPIGRGGCLEFELEGHRQAVRLLRVHIEEDAAKLLHDRGGSRIDFNRSGVALVELVTRPDLRRPEEASACVAALRHLLRWLGICDGNMEEGSLRCDANISLGRRGAMDPGPRTELKNLNSFRAIERALHFEIERQHELVARGLPVRRETRLWNEREECTRALRGKEDLIDYRYFPEPDLRPLLVDPAWQEEIRGDLPELPDARRDRFVSQYGLSEYDANVLTSERPLADYYEAVVESCQDPLTAAHWVTGEVLRHVDASRLDPAELPVPAPHLGELLLEMQRGNVSRAAAREVFAAMLAKRGRARQIISDKSLGQIRDRAQLADTVDAVLAARADLVAAYRAGKHALIEHFMGEVMKCTRGRAHPEVVRSLLMERLEET